MIELKMYGTFEQECYNCDGTLDRRYIYTFDGSTFTYTFIMLAGTDDPVVYNDPTVWPVSDFGSPFYDGCYIEGNTGRSYIDLAYDTGRSRIGPSIRVYNYGTYRLEWPDMDDEGNCFWDENLDPPGWDNFSAGPVVTTSYPRIEITVKRNGEVE